MRRSGRDDETDNSIRRRYLQRHRPRTDLKNTTEQVLADLLHSSRFFEENPNKPLAHFVPEEIETGVLLGEGEFGVVHEVVRLRLDEVGDAPPTPIPTPTPPSSFALPATTPPQSIVLPSVDPTIALGSARTIDPPDLSLAQHDDDLTDTLGRAAIVESLHPSSHSEGLLLSDSVSEVDVDDDLSLHSHLYQTTDHTTLRRTMSSHAVREGQARYAVKRLKDSLERGSKEHFDASLDLACEAKFLASISHSNIVRLRGIVGEPGTVDYALVLDRLTCTLEHRMVEWKHLQQKYSGFLGMGRNSSALQHMLAERLLAVFDIARAMRHLHSLKILYRDLKPDNVGFDVRGNVRIFDFGIAKELKLRDLVQEPDGFDATGLTGSQRYMSPECARCCYYGFSSDVYSFAVLAWEMLSLQTPFANYDSTRHFENVVGKGKRPPRIKNMPLYPLLSKAWAENPATRPPFHEICPVVQEEIKERIQGASILSIDDRTMFLTERSVASMIDE